MSRANIFFTSGYRLYGDVDVAALQESYAVIVGAVEKFQHGLRFQAQNDYAWCEAEGEGLTLGLRECDDVDTAFGELCRESLSFHGEQRHCPMSLTLLRNRHDARDVILAQTCEHTYVDARGAESVLNLIVDHYNATLRGDGAAASAALAAARNMSTLSGHDMAGLLAGAGHDRDANLAHLQAYPVADAGQFAIQPGQVPDLLEQYQRQRFAPLVRYHDIASLLQACRAQYPEVTQNSVVCAALAKGVHDINVAQRGVASGHTVSFKMLSDLLAPSMRAQYCGNYIAFVPVSVDGSLPMAELAKAIHDRIRHFKESQLDLTIFKLTEEAVDAALVGQEAVTDPLAFVVTNWNNYRFLGDEEYLHGCRSVRHQSGVNIAPKDALGAGLVNRPVMVINMSAKLELCLSFFPSLRAQEENLAVADAIGAVFAQHDATA
ncbi:hypothetical protein [Rugamonas apoptosis]|uniref:Condensation domain-containing protein n=1 Tax=Rugamonas apoptosis TaxID=2758570 RepID=A0A7W2F968_9BURK|nr:hypothetical protein [Rugamonas apoptosis]MBA5687413.1 hypothetical protein [Rugamonas apoptosis]